MTQGKDEATWHGVCNDEDIMQNVTMETWGFFSNRGLLDTVRAVRNDATGIWHLLGSRGCGAEPDGAVVEGSWAEVRDRVERDSGETCSNCRWPRA